MRKLLLLIIIFPFLSCNHNKDSKSVFGTEDFSVVLNKKIDSGGQSHYSLKILDSIPGELSGVPKLDTMKLQYFAFRSALSPDSISPDKLYAYSGYEKGRFVISYDLNFNKNLSDDQKHYFDRPYGKWTRRDNYGKDVKFDTLEYSVYKKGKEIKDSLVYKVLPNDSSIVKPTDPLYTELILKMPTYSHWWYGTFTLEDKKFKTSVNPEGFRGTSFAFSKLEEDFSTGMNYDFVDIKLKDTVQLEGSYYRIDSIGADFSELFIKDLKIKSKPFGYLKGDKIKNIKFNDMNFRSTSFSKLLVNKEYLLIDFWGTWCAPCLKLTPEVIKLNNEYSEKLGIVGFAYDKERNKVYEHIKKHKMDWNHVFLGGDPKGIGQKLPKIINDLKIEGYPTFMLLDKELNILLRGTGGKTLEKVREILSNDKD